MANEPTIIDQFVLEYHIDQMFLPIHRWVRFKGAEKILTSFMKQKNIKFSHVRENDQRNDNIDCLSRVNLEQSSSSLDIFFSKKKRETSSAY